jgi:16S rRNA processing protein RimM
VDTPRRRFSASSPLRKVANQPDVRWIGLGYVAGSHGLHGGLRVKLHNPDSALLSELAEIGVRRDGETTAYAIRAVRGAAKGLLLELQGVDRVEEADALRGSELCVPRELLPPLPDGEYYFVDLEGLPVFLPDGTPSGVVERVQEYPAAQVLRVKSEEGVREVPMRAPYLIEVDLPGRRIVVDELHDLDVEKPR